MKATIKALMLNENEFYCLSAALHTQLDLLMDVVERDTNESMKVSAYQAADTLYGVIEKLGMQDATHHWENERHTKHSMM